MHKNAIKIVGGVKFSKKIPQNVGFFDQKGWDFQHRGGDFRPLTSGHTVHSISHVLFNYLH